MGTNFKFLDSDKSAKSMDSGNKSFLLLVMGCQAITLGDMLPCSPIVQLCSRQCLNTDVLYLIDCAILACLWRC